MKLDFMNKTWEAARRAGGVISVSNVMLSAALLLSVGSQMTQHDRVVLTPPYLEGKAEINWNSANAEYMKSFGMYFAVLTANITPKNVEMVTENLSALVDARIYPEIRKKMRAIADDPLFRAQGAATRFDVTRVFYESETGKVFVLGDMTTSTAVSRGDPSPMVYEMNVAIREGKPVVTAVNWYEGQEPHTLRWLEAHPPAPKKQTEEGASK